MKHLFEGLIKQRGVVKVNHKWVIVAPFNSDYQKFIESPYI